MIGRLDLDNDEAKKCNNHNVGKKLPSYRKGFQAGLRDGKQLEIQKREKNPYLIDPEVMLLLKKRARWQMGYEYGFQIGGRKRRLKLGKKRKRRED
jgi:hypothetical protein